MLRNGTYGLSSLCEKTNSNLWRCHYNGSTFSSSNCGAHFNATRYSLLSPKYVTKNRSQRDLEIISVFVNHLNSLPEVSRERPNFQATNGIFVFCSQLKQIVER